MIYCTEIGAGMLYQVLLFGIIVCTDAQVYLTTLSSLNNEMSYVCGRPETLICTTVPSVVSLTWEIDSTQAAFCLNNACVTNPSYTANYMFKFNVSAGIFRMKKSILTLSDNGTKFTCDDGSSSDVELAIVKVADDYNYKNDTEVDYSTKLIKFKVETGCLKTVTANSVRFKWFYRKVNTSEDRKEYKNVSSEQIFQTKNESDCISDPDCGAVGFTKTTSSLILMEDKEGVIYHFEVDIYFGNKTQNVQFQTGVTLNVSADVCVKCPGGWPDVCILCVIFSAAVFVCVLLLSCVIHFADLDTVNSTKRYYIGIVCGVALISTCIALVVVCCKKGSKEETNGGISDQCIAGTSEETCGILDGCVTGISITVVDSVVLVIDIFMLCYKKTIANKR